MAKKISVGLITNGEGAHVSAYLPALAAAEHCEQVFLSDPDGRWEDSARQTLGDKLAGVHKTPPEMLRRRQPELCLISLEARLAPPVIEQAIDANSHVFAEKPACVRSEDFQRLKDKADSKHRNLMLALANRTNPEVQAARSLFQAGRIGELYGVELHLIADQTRLTRTSYHQQWFADKQRAGGGHLVWLGIHWLDLAMYITGQSIAEVAGFTNNVGGQPINIEDSATASLRFQSGALGVMTSGYYLDRGYHSHIKIWGSAGWLLIEPKKPQMLTWYANDGDNAREEQQPKIAANPRGYTPFVQAAVQACAEMTEPPISNEDSLRAIRTVYTIYEAAEKGETLSIER